jgi:hypothetical protein
VCVCAYLFVVCQLAVCVCCLTARCLCVLICFVRAGGLFVYSVTAVGLCMFVCVLYKF